MFKKKVFYIHGITSYKDNNPLLKEITEGMNMKFYSVDLPGHNDEGFSEIDLNIETFGEYVKKYMIENKIKRRIILYGHSMGGAIATYIASKYKRKLGIKKLILEDPLNSSIEHNIRGSKISIISRKIKEVRQTRADNIINVSSSWYEWFKKFSSRIPRERWSDFVELAKNIVSREALNNLDIYYKNLKVNTQVIFGANDFVIPCDESINNLISLNKKIKTTIIKNAGHSPNKENPEEYKKWLSNVLK